MTNKVITISRQFGSGGRSIGKAGICTYKAKLYDYYKPVQRSA